MSIYTLNSTVKKNDEKNLFDISNVLNKKNIWINHSLEHTKRLGWLDFNGVLSSSQDMCIDTIKGLSSKKIIFIGMGGSIQTGKVLNQISNKNNKSGSPKNLNPSRNCNNYCGGCEISPSVCVYPNCKYMMCSYNES